jgi:hypothetical protein
MNDRTVAINHPGRETATYVADKTYSPRRGMVRAEPLCES